MGMFAAPLPREKIEDLKKWTGELQGKRRADFEAFNRKMGLTTHRAWLTELPSGPGVIVQLQGPGADRYLERVFAESDPFTTWFRERVIDLHGMDPKQPPQGGSELFIDWNEATAKV